MLQPTTELPNDLLADDAALLSRFVDKRSADAFETIVRRHAGWIWGVARRRLRDSHAADDVVQAVFLLLARQAASIRDPSRLAAWLARSTDYCVRHVARTQQRRLHHERAAAHAVVDFTDKPSGEADADDRERTAALDAAIARLGATDRDVVVRRFYRCESLEQIGTSLGLSADATRKRLTRALERLQRYLGPEGRGWLAGVGVVPAVTAPGHLQFSAVAQAALQPITAATHAAAIMKGARAMVVRSKIRATAIAALVTATVLTLGAAAVHALQEQEVSGATVSAITPSPATQERVVNPGDWTASTGVLVRWSADGSQLIGYSYTTGTWEAAPLPAAATRDAFAKTIVSADVAATVAGDQLLAFSGRTGKWDAAQLAPEDAADGFAHLSVSTHVAATMSGKHAFAFSATNGKWDVAELSGEVSDELAVASDFAQVRTRDRLYVFSATAGKWAQPLP